MTLSRQPLTEHRSPLLFDDGAVGWLVNVGRVVLGIVLSVGFGLGEAKAGSIAENFDGETFNEDFFEFADGTGLISNGRMISINRALFRTTRDDLIPTASAPLTIQADLTFLASQPEVAFLAWRADGQTEPVNREPNTTLYYRIHNFIGGEVNLALGPNTSSGPNYEGFLLTAHNPGDAFWTVDQTVRILVVDDGSQVTSTFLNLNTGESFMDSETVTASMPVNYVLFSGNSAGAESVAWDNIVISHAAIPTQDTDNDGIPDTTDNCLLVPNTSQLNSDIPPDAYGNACDADISNDGLVDGIDFAYFLSCFIKGFVASFPECATSDFDGDGAVTGADFTETFLPQFSKGTPGP